MYVPRFALGLLGAAVHACDGGGGGGAADPPEVGELDARREAAFWDASGDGERQRPRFEGGVEPDGGVPGCLAEGAPLEDTYTSDPIAGLQGVRADVDPDEDGRADLLLFLEGPELQLRDGRSAEVRGRFAAAAGRSLDFMPGLWTAPSLVTPLAVGDEKRFLLLDQDADDAVLRLLDPDDLAELDHFELNGPVVDLYLMDAGAGWLVAVNHGGEEGACGVYPLDGRDALGFWPECRLKPAWDVNGDGAVDLLRTGATGTAVLDLRLVEPVMALPPPAVTLGYVPVSPVPGGPEPGPADLRGRGPEVVSAQIEGTQLFIRWLDPVELSTLDEAQPIGGEFVRVEFWPSPEGLRMLLEEQRQLARELRIYELRNLRVRAQFGPFVNLDWRPGPDLDGDGFPEVALRTGPRADGLNSELQYVRASDGAEVLLVQQERSARYDPLFVRRDGLARAADLDGCEGEEVVLLRTGERAADGKRPSRVHVIDLTGREVFRGESQTGVTHALALGDLDGRPPFELVEVLSDGAAGARLHVRK